MPSETIYFPDEIHREVTERVAESDQNTSQVVQELVFKGLTADDTETQE